MSDDQQPKPVSYSANVEDADQTSQKEAAARDLFQRIRDHLRGERDRTARRWPWELIQNAHDVSELARGVHVRVQLSEEAPDPSLTFEHDAGPFSSADLVSLVKRHSGKRGGPVEGRPAPLGRFGTGFLTTHLLARHVDLSGVVSDPGLVGRPFRLPLDRTGASENEMRGGVEAAFDVLHHLDALPPLGDNASPPTTYRYRLQPDGLQAARTGLDDLDRLAPFVLAFVPAVRSITVEGGDAGPVRYEVAEHATLDGEVHHVRVRVMRDDGPRDISLLLAGDGYDPAAPDPAGDGGVLVAVHAEVDLDGAVTLLDLDDRTPRLFCGLPLVGTEALGLPVVVSARAFAPATERDGLVLTDVQEDQVLLDSDANKRLLQAAVRHTQTLLNAAADWRRAYALAGVPAPPALPWLQDKAWYQQHVTAPLREAVALAPLVERPGSTRGTLGEHGVARLSRVPAGPSVAFRAALWNLAAPLLADKMPRLDDVEPWRERLSWTSFYDLDAVHLVAHVTSAKTLAGLADALGSDDDEARLWVQRLIDLLLENGFAEYLDPLTKELWGRAEGTPWKRKAWTWKPSAVPDQHGRFRPLGDLQQDPGLPDALKDVATALGHDVRSDLAGVDVSGLRADYTAETLAQTIESEAFDRLDDGDPSVSDAFANLLAWFDGHPDEAARLFKRLFPKQHLLRTAEEARRDRRDAADARQLRKENDTLAAFKTLLETENAELKEELNRLRQATPTGVASVPLDDLAVQLKHHVLEVWDAVRKALAAEGTAETTAASHDLERLRQRHPALFEHLSGSAFEAYARWHGMVDRAKERTREKMKALGYDTDAWRSAEAFPTIVEGVRRHPVRGDRVYPPHEVTLVVRPADGGYIVLYDAQEVAVLQNADAELWVEGGGLHPQRFTIGHLAEALDANRFPVRSRVAVAQPTAN